MRYSMLRLVAALTFVATAFAGVANVYPYAGQPFSAAPYNVPQQYRHIPQYTRYNPVPEVVIAPTTAAPFVQAYATPTPYIQSYAPSHPYIPIVRHDQETREDGSYQYQYETANGIVAEEHGGVKDLGSGAGSVAQGSYSYTSPEGKVISISYIADENGFRAFGDAIPTPPPVPIAIQRALAYIAAHPQRVENTYEQKYY